MFATHHNRPRLVVHNVKLYHSHTFNAHARQSPDGWVASVSIHFYTREGELYCIKPILRERFTFRWAAINKAQRVLNRFEREHLQGNIHHEALVEIRRCFNTSKGN